MRGKLAIIAATWLAGCGVLVGSSDDDPVPTTVPSGDASSDTVVTPPPPPAPTDGSTAEDAGVDAGCGDTATDPNNCGACGHKCNADGGCAGGVCDRGVVFVTSQTFQGGEFLGTLADTKCTTIANDAGLSGNFRVWLTHPTQPNRMATLVARPYYTTSGAIVSNKWPPGSSLVSPIDTDEKKRPVGQSFAWSNLTGSGTLATGLNNCLGWGSNAANQQGTFGLTNVTDNGWTEGTDPNNNNATVMPCSSSLHLYCVEWP